MMYAKLPNLVIGFHGCNREAYENVIYRNQSLKASCKQRIKENKGYSVT